MKGHEWMYRRVLFPTFSFGRKQSVVLLRSVFGLLSGNHYIDIEQLMPLLTLKESIGAKEQQGQQQKQQQRQDDIAHAGHIASPNGMGQCEGGRVHDDRAGLDAKWPEGESSQHVQRERRGGGEEQEEPHRRDDVLVIDARRKDEYEYSHIKGAINVHYVFKKAWIPGKAKKAAKDIIEFLPQDLREDKDLPIVVYCGVGLRSNLLLARALRKKYHFRNVRVLKGALYQWVNLNLPLYNVDGYRLTEEEYFVKAQHWLATTVIMKEKTFNSEKQRQRRIQARRKKISKREEQKRRDRQHTESDRH